MTQGKRKMPQDKAQMALEGFDRLFADIDPAVMAAGALGAIAASGGIVPPFTRLLMAFNTNISTQDVTSLIVQAGMGPIGGVASVWSGLAAFFVGQNDDGTPVSPAKYALAASGAMEGMLMMSLVNNPGTMDLLGKIIEKVPGSIPIPV